MGELINEFSWSKSRDEKFRTCPRQYYFQYYGTWGGWDLQADPRVRKAYILKQLKTRAMWAGEKVHDCIKRSLQNLRRGIEPMGETEAVEATLEIMRKDYLNSKRGDFWKNPKSCGLFEHEYALEIPDSAWKETADHVAHCLHNFYGSEVYRMVQGLKGNMWLDVEDFSHFYLEGTKIHVVLDFSCRRGEEILIYDWKTGRSDAKRNELQLACYCLYAVDKWLVAPKQVKTVEFNLASGRDERYVLEGSDLKAIQNHIQSSVRDMKRLLDDPENNQASEERFAFVEEERICRWCVFRKVCPLYGGE